MTGIGSVGVEQRISLRPGSLVSNVPSHGACRLMIASICCLSVITKILPFALYLLRCHDRKNLTGGTQSTVPRTMSRGEVLRMCRFAGEKQPVFHWLRK